MEKQARKSLDRHEGSIKGNSSESLVKEESFQESLKLLREVVVVIMLVETQVVKAILVTSWTEVRNVVLEISGKAVLVIKWQRSWLICAKGLYGRQNLRVMNLDIWLKKYLSKMLKGLPGVS